MLSLERYDETEKSLIRVIKKDSEHREARLLLVQMYVKQGRNTEAIVMLEGLAEDYPQEESILLLLSGCQVASGVYIKAMESLDKAMRLNPRRAECYLNMAWLLVEMNSNLATAENYYRKGVSLGAGRDRELEKILGIDFTR